MGFLCCAFQRTQTLLKEYKEKDRSSVLKDKRIGEYDTTISPEEKMMKRFTLEQQVNIDNILRKETTRVFCDL